MNVWTFSFSLHVIV